MSKPILIIDDEELITKTITKLLSRHGYESVACGSGDEALKKVRQYEFGLILSDIRMPGINGIETIKKIREILKKEKKTPIPEILITGYADEELSRQAEALKVADYILKPFDLRDLMASIEKHWKG